MTTKATSSLKIKPSAHCLVWAAYCLLQTGFCLSAAVKPHKPLSARLLPVEGKRAGDRTEFEDPFLVNATIQELP